MNIRANDISTSSATGKTFKNSDNSSVIFYDSYLSGAISPLMHNSGLYIVKKFLGINKESYEQVVSQPDVYLKSSKEVRTEGQNVTQVVHVENNQPAIPPVVDEKSAENNQPVNPPVVNEKPVENNQPANPPVVNEKPAENQPANPPVVNEKPAENQPANPPVVNDKPAESNQPLNLPVVPSNSNVFSYHGLDRFSDDTDTEWNERTSSMSSFYNQYLDVHDKLASYKIDQGSIGTYIVPPNENDPKKFVYITGSSSNHFGTNICMLMNLFLMDLNASVVFISFGLDQRETTIIFNFLNKIQEIRSKLYTQTGHFYYREISWKANPQFLQKSYYGSIYALKSIATVNIAEECHCKVFWLDAGDQIGPYFPKLLRTVEKNGVQTAYSRGNVEGLTNKKMMEWFTGKIPHIYGKKDMCSGGFLGLDYNHNSTFKNVGLMLRECCYRKKCITPEGAQKWNHRYDQSALSLLVHAYDLSQACNMMTPGVVRFQYDRVVDTRGFSKVLQESMTAIERKYKIGNFSQSILKVL